MVFHSFRRLSAGLGLLGVLGASLSGCGGGSSSGGGTGTDTRQACTANTPKGGARWTILVYMNASNNLQPFSLLNIAQMASVGSDSDVNIVVQWKQTSADRISNCSDCAPSFLGTRRYLIRKHTAAQVSSLCSSLSDFSTCARNETVLDSDRLPNPTTNTTYTDPVSGQTVSTSDMGDYKVLDDFVHWGVQNYPADHMALLIWDHGSGWRPVYRSAQKRTITRAVSQDDDTANEIQTWQIASAINSRALAQPLDMIIFDASLEGMLEIAYELRNSARVMVGSEESPPGAGYPYHQWLAALKASGKNPCDLGSSIVNTFVANYTSASDVTQAVYDLTKAQNVANQLDAFGNSLFIHHIQEQTLIQTARDSAQPYGAGNSLYTGNIDLYDFADRIATGTSFSDLKQAAKNVQSALTAKPGGMILTNAHGSTGQANSNGLAIYVPPPSTFDSALQASYAQLALSKATPNWTQFLKVQLQ